MVAAAGFLLSIPLSLPESLSFTANRLPAVGQVTRRPQTTYVVPKHPHYLVHLTGISCSKPLLSTVATREFSTGALPPALLSQNDAAISSRSLFWTTHWPGRGSINALIMPPENGLSPMPSSEGQWP